MNSTFVFLLAGGEGKRLGVLTRNRPKPLVPFAGQYRLIDFPLSNAANSGVQRMGILVQKSHRSIMEYVGTGKIWGLYQPKAKLLVLPPHTNGKSDAPYCGTADAVRRNMALIAENPDYETVLVLSSDHVYKMDYQKLIAFHRRRKADVTVGVTQVSAAEIFKFGIVHMDRRSKIIRWQEKPSHSSSTLASMGIYVFSKKFLMDVLEKCPGTDFGRHIIPFACQHANIYGYTFSGYWRDVGSPDAYWQANMDLLDAHKNIKIHKWNITTNPGAEWSIQQPTKSGVVYPAAYENSIISQNALLQGRALNSIIFPGVQIDKNVTVRNSIIMNDCVIAPNSLIANSILCDNVRVGEGSVVGMTQLRLPCPEQRKSQNKIGRAHV